MTRRMGLDCLLGKKSCLNASSDGRVVYKGNWKNDQPHGEGLYRFRNGDIYAGMHDDGDYHGTGRFIGIDGTEYQGEWVKGKREGKAVYYSKQTGVATVGIWEADKFVKYISHKVVSPNLPGQNPEPLKEGFDWNSYRGVVPHTHSHGSHEHDGCGDCGHDHGAKPPHQVQSTLDIQDRSPHANEPLPSRQSNMDEEKPAQSHSDCSHHNAHHHHHHHEKGHHHHHEHTGNCTHDRGTHQHHH